MADKPRSLTDAPGVKLPKAANAIAKAHPELWATYQKLGELVSEAGPLSPRERRLVHLAYALGSASEGAAHSHLRRSLSEGLSVAELEHLALLSVTTLGWPQAVRALSIVHDVALRQGQDEE
jgi:alkylhydroperoxidase/carboxymuconolactone decarboxylase family protein YurZ